MNFSSAVHWLQARWLLGARRFDVRSLRERMLILIGAALGLLLLWNGLVMRPLYETARRATAQLSAMAPDTKLTNEPGRMLDLATQLQAQQVQTELRLEQRAASLVDPEKMILLLTDIIRSSRGLHLVKLANLPVEELRGPTAASGTVADTSGANVAAETAPAVAYVHGIDITVAGDFGAVSRYISALETQDWHFLWRKLEIDAGNYPEVSAHIEVATLGLERQWLTL